MPAMMQPTSPGDSSVDRLHLGSENTHGLHLVDGARRVQLDLLSRADAAVNDPDQNDNALVWVIPGVENQRPKAAHRGRPSEAECA